MFYAPYLTNAELGLDGPLGRGNTPRFWRGEVTGSHGDALTVPFPGPLGRRWIADADNDQVGRQKRSQEAVGVRNQSKERVSIQHVENRVTLLRCGIPVRQSHITVKGNPSGTPFGTGRLIAPAEGLKFPECVSRRPAPGVVFRDIEANSGPR
jgi:hypothetical protein